MKVALVHDWLTGMRGGEKCLEVFCRMFPQADLHTLLHVRGAVSPLIERMRIGASFLQRFPGVRHYYRYTLPLMPRAIESLAIDSEVDLVLSSSHAVAKGIRVPEGIPHVCYCYTPMRYAWHMRESYFGKANRWTHPLKYARERQLDKLRAWDRATHERVTRFVAISRAVSKRIAECYNRESEVIYPPVDTGFYTPVPLPREDYYLCVSALVPYKRLDLAVRACAQTRRRLVVIGAGPELKRLRAAAGPTVEFLGWRRDDEIREHYRRARALLFPGHEDFGIVPLEAQACGLPVIAFAEGGALETIRPASAGQPGSGVLFGEQSVDVLIAAIESLEQGNVALCSRAARENAVRFGVERFEREISSLLANAVSRRIAA